MTGQNEGLLTDEEREKAYEKGFDVEVKAYNLTEEIEMKRFEGRKFVAKAQLAKLNKLGWMSPDECQECQAQTECKIELAVKAERERIMREIEKCETPTVRDLNLIQITMCREDWQALKGEPTIKPLQVLVNGEWREASKELKATADSIEQSLKEGLK